MSKITFYSLLLTLYVLIKHTPSLAGRGGVRGTTCIHRFTRSHYLRANGRSRLPYDGVFNVISAGAIVLWSLDDGVDFFARLSLPCTNRQLSQGRAGVLVSV